VSRLNGDADSAKTYYSEYSGSNTTNKNPPLPEQVCTDCEEDCNPYWYLKVAGFLLLVAFGLPVITGNKKF